MDIRATLFKRLRYLFNDELIQALEYLWVTYA